MHRLLQAWIPGAVLIAAVGSAPAAAAASISPAGAAAVSRPAGPAVEVCGRGPALVRPSSAILTCADDGTIAEHLHWSSWTATRAMATGIITWRACSANCADSKNWDSTMADVTLTHPVHEPGKGILFTRLDLHVTGHTPPRFMRNVVFSEVPIRAVAPTPPQARGPAAALPSQSPQAPSGSLGYAQIEGLWIRADGLSGSDGSYTYPQVAAAITGAESSFLPGIIQPGVDYCGAGSDRAGWGLWQITCGNSVPQYGTDFQILDPWNNAEEAVYKFDAAGGFSPWTTYLDGAYASYLQHTAPDTAVTDPGEYVQINSTPPGTPSSPPAAPGSTYGPPVASVASTAAPFDHNLLNVFEMGGNGHLYQSYEQSNGQFTGWAAIAGSFPGGVLQGSIAVTPAPASSNLINVFAFGSNGHLYQSYEQSNGQFTGWAAIAGSFPGGSLQGSIAVTPAPASSNLINVFALGSNGHLYQSYEQSNGQFTGWAAIAGSFPGGSLQGSIAVTPAPASSNLINVFALGSNGHLYQSYEQSNGQFTGWAAIAGSFPGGSLQGSIAVTPAPASSNLINVFALGSNGHLYQSYEQSNGQFTGWAAIAGSFPGSSLQGSIAVTPAPASSNLINVFALGSNGHLYQSYEQSNGQFTGWAAIAGSFPGGSLQGSIAVTPAPASSNLINVFALGSNSHLYQSYEQSNGQFTGWAAIAGTLPT